MSREDEGGRYSQKLSSRPVPRINLEMTLVMTHQWTILQRPLDAGDGVRFLVVRW